MGQIAHHMESRLKEGDQARVREDGAEWMVSGRNDQP